jgi:hypothetical protein
VTREEKGVGNYQKMVTGVINCGVNDFLWIIDGSGNLKKWLRMVGRLAIFCG